MQVNMFWKGSTLYSLQYQGFFSYLNLSFSFNLIVKTTKTCRWTYFCLVISINESNIKPRIKRGREMVYNWYSLHSKCLYSLEFIFEFSKNLFVKTAKTYRKSWICVVISMNLNNIKSSIKNEMVNNITPKFWDWSSANNEINIYSKATFI
jgi:hypothetical protein